MRGVWLSCLLMGCPAFGPGDKEALFDADGDGFEGAGGPDCDDDDPAVHPDATEVCDGIDNDCDGLVDDDDGFDPSTGVEAWPDADGDGFGAVGAQRVVCAAGEGEVLRGGDCADGLADVHPDATEVCDGVDNDCDTLIDDADEVASPTRWYVDGDDDGFGGAEGPLQCAAPPGHVSREGDCDDADDGVHPDATEVCGGADEDCDGLVDDDDPSVTERSTFYVDGDGDGHGDAAQPVQACALPDGAASAGDDCDDTRADTHPGADEQWYDDIDQACDGGDDHDADGDGFVRDLSGGSDCDDGDAAVHPAATEVFYDGVDGDCDGGSDYDADGDGYDHDGYGGTDCRDDDAHIGPHATEVFYDGVDADCDGGSDYDADGDGFDAFAYGGDDCDDTSEVAFPGALVLVPDDAATVQAALDLACEGSTVQLAPGTYFERLVVRRSVVLQGDGVAEDVVIDAEGLGRGVDVRSTADEVVLRDLTVRRGDAVKGGGVKIEGAGDVTLERVIVEACDASDDGGGLYAEGADRVALIDTLLQLNVGEFGGGARLDGNRDVVLDGVVFADNTAFGLTGGGLYMEVDLADRSCLLDGVDFVGNSASWAPAAYVDVDCDWYDIVAADNDGGSVFGALSIKTPGTVDGVLAVGNLVGLGPAVNLDLYLGAGPARNVHAIANEGDGIEVAFGGAEVSNLLAAGNTGDGMVLDYHGLGGGLVASQLTAAGNDGAGILFGGTEPITVEGAVSVGNGGAGLYDPGSTPVTVSYSLMWGNAPNWSGLPDATGVRGNLSADPLFVSFVPSGDPLGFDLQPGAGSPLIDSGPPGQTDPDGSTADMGAYGGPWADAP